MARHIILRVAEVTEAGPGIRRFVLQDPDGWPLPRVRAGAHVDIQVPGIGPRAYSLCGDPAEQDRWAIAVRRETPSRGGSAWLHESVAVGDTIHAAMPRCTFPIAEDAMRHVMVAGGIGVTPFLAMAPVLERAGRDWTLHVLHRGAVPCSDALAPWIARGRVTLHDTTTASRPVIDSLLGRADQAYCCGPTGLLDDFAAATACWPSGRARVEHFIPPPRLADPAAQAYTLVRAPSGQRIAAEAGETVLSALRRMGAAVETSCEGGICGACEVRWIEGTPLHHDLVLTAPRRATHLMACVAQCASDTLVVEA